MAIRNPRPDPVDIPRSSLAEDSLAEYVIPMDRIYSDGAGGSQFGEADKLAMGIAAAQPGLGINDASATESRIKTTTASNDGVNGSGEFEFGLPPEFVSGGTIKLRVRSQYTIQVDPNITVKTLDAAVHPIDGAGDLGADDVSTGVQTVTASWVNYDFELAGSYSAGQRFRWIFTLTFTEAGGGGGVFGQVSGVAVLLDIKG